MAIGEQDLRNAERRMATVRQGGFAVAARYDRRTANVVIGLSTGVEIWVAARLIEGLAGAGPDELAVIEISPAGLGLHWPKLDADVHVPALLQGLFGSGRTRLAAELGAAGGKARTRAKTQAARVNGRKGGRPRKTTGG
jgi:protein involved in temperature-dependent protein secretion